jgi:hypothetical protein
MILFGFTAATIVVVFATLLGAQLSYPDGVLRVNRN